MKIVSPTYTTHAQEPRALVHKRQLALPFKSGDSRAHINHARGLEFLQPQSEPQLFLLLYNVLLILS